MVKPIPLCAHRPDLEGSSPEAVEGSGSRPCVTVFTACDSAFVRETHRWRQQESGSVERWPLSSECSTGETAGPSEPQGLHVHLLTSSFS